MSKANESDEQMPSWREVSLYFLFLGFVSVGGPVAQITMMLNHMVEQRRWLTKDRFVTNAGRFITFFTTKRAATVFLM